MKKGLLSLRVETCLRGDQFEDRKGIKRPTVAGSHDPKFLFAFGQGDVEAFFPLLRSFEQILKTEGRFACAGRTFDKVKPITIQTSA